MIFKILKEFIILNIIKLKKWLCIHKNHILELIISSIIIILVVPVVLGNLFAMGLSIFLYWTCFVLIIMISFFSFIRPFCLWVYENWKQAKENLSL
jgi:uncharacterized RDD family membrane protein YckC